MYKNCRQIMAKAEKAFVYGIILLKGRTEKQRFVLMMVFSELTAYIRYFFLYNQDDR